LALQATVFLNLRKTIVKTVSDKKNTNKYITFNEPEKKAMHVSALDFCKKQRAVHA